MGREANNAVKSGISPGPVGRMIENEYNLSNNTAAAIVLCAMQNNVYTGKNVKKRIVGLLAAGETGAALTAQSRWRSASERAVMIGSTFAAAREPMRRSPWKDLEVPIRGRLTLA